MSSSLEISGRRELGRLMRSLRREAGLSGRQLGKAASISQSKISRIETGESVASVADIKELCRVLEVDSAVVNALTERAIDLVAHDTPTLVSNWHFTSDPDYGASLESKCSRYLVSTPGGIPVLLQTEKRIELLIKQMTPSLSEREQAQIKIVRLERQLKMMDPGRSFQFLIDRASLRRRAGSFDEHVEQLRLIIRLSKLPNVEIRYIADDCAAGVGLACWYGVHDSSSVIVDGIDMDRASTTTPVVDIYANTFASYWQLAVGGEAMLHEVDNAMRDVELFVQSHKNVDLILD